MTPEWQYLYVVILLSAVLGVMLRIMRVPIVTSIVIIVVAAIIAEIGDHVIDRPNRKKDE